MEYTDKVLYIQKYLSGQMDSEEKVAFDIWKSSSVENDLLAQQIGHIWMNAVPKSLPSFNAHNAFQRHLETIKTDQNTITSVPQDTKVRTLSFSRMWQSIAAMVVFVLVSLVVFKITSEDQYYAADNQKVTLSDGSEIWMDKGAVLTYSDKFGKRTATLQGKAYFNVAKETGKPFVISSDDVNVRVLGTKFIVDTDSKQVFVREGKVEVSAAKEKVILIDNQKVKVSQGKLSEVEKVIFNTEDVWFNEDLTFDNVPFDKVMGDISIAYGVRFELPANKDWKQCTFTSGSLKKNSLDQVLTTLKLTYELEYTKTAEKAYKLSRVKCK